MDTYTFQLKNAHGNDISVSGTIKWKLVPGGWLATCNSLGLPEFQVEAPTQTEALIEILKRRLL